MLDNFADVNCKNKKEDTPLFLAATDLNFKECVKLLLEYGACVNIRNKKKLNIIQYVKSNDLRTYIESKYCLLIFLNRWEEWNEFSKYSIKIEDFKILSPSNTMISLSNYIIYKTTRY